MKIVPILLKIKIYIAEVIQQTITYKKQKS